MGLQDTRGAMARCHYRHIEGTAGCLVDVRQNLAQYICLFEDNLIRNNMKKSFVYELPIVIQPPVKLAK